MPILPTQKIAGEAADINEYNHGVLLAGLSGVLLLELSTVISKKLMVLYCKLTDLVLLEIEAGRGYTLDPKLVEAATEILAQRVREQQL